MTNSEPTPSHGVVLPVKKIPWYFTRKAAIWGLVIVGPMALPLVLVCRDFKKSTKIIISAVLILVTYATWIYTPILMENMMKRLEEYQALTGS